MLVQRDELSENVGVDLLHEDGVRWPVTVENLEGNEFCDLGFGLTGGRQLVGDLAGGLAVHQGFGLGEEVTQQNGVVIAEGVVADGRRDEVAGDQAGTLVDQLVKSVLAVGAGLTPDDGAGFVVDGVAVAVDAFAVGLHVPLLEVGREAVEVLIVGKDRFGFRAEEVGVPDADQGQADGQVILQRSGAKMLVHALHPVEEAGEVVKADRQGDAQADGGGEAVAATDPVPETKDVIGRDPKFLSALDVGGQGGEVPGNVGFATAVVVEPLAGGAGVGHRFLGREGLGGDEEERRFRVDLFEDFGEVGTVDVADEVDFAAVDPVGFEGFGDHDGAEIGTTDSDINHLGELLAGAAGKGAAVDFGAKVLHPVQHFTDLPADVFAVYLHVEVAVTQGDVEHGAVFGSIDGLSGKHFFGGFPDAAGLCEAVEDVHRLLGDDVFGVVQQDVLEGLAEVGEAVGVLGEEVLHVARGHFMGVHFEFAPGEGGGGVDVG